VSQRALGWVAEVLGCPVVAGTALRGGLDAQVTRLDLADGRRAVLRKVPAYSSYAARLFVDIAVLQALSGAGLPLPQVLASDVGGDRAGMPTLLLSWLPGEADPVMPPARAATQLEPLFCAFAGLPVEGELRRAPDLLTEVLGQAAGPPPAGLARLADGAELWSRFGALAPPSDTPRSVVHADVWVGNILWSGDRLSGVLDVGDAALAEPAADRAVLRVDLVALHGEGAEHHVAPAVRQDFWDARVALLWVAMVDRWWPMYA
jgi:aminoglycoside phosphotransferase (APT) family kinase protein